MKNRYTFFLYPAFATTIFTLLNLAACSSSPATTSYGLTSGAGGSAGTVYVPSGTGGQIISGGVGASGQSGMVASGSGGSVVPPITGGISGGGVGGTPVVTGGVGGVFDSGVDGSTAGSSGEAGTAGTAAGAGGQAGVAPGCTGLTIPPVTDYAVNGPFATTTVNNTGPDGTYTMFKPRTLGDNGFTKHPIASWGNGITTTPALYPGLLGAVASHGFVLIASNSTNVTAAMMTAGLDWLIQQNTASGEFQGKLATECAITIGYSLGGGAAVTSGSHKSSVATVSFHGLPGAAANLNGPLLLFTSTADGFVTKAGFVQPCYTASTKMPTIMATLEVPGAAADIIGHLYPLGDAGEERAPAMAWLRLWVYGDTGGKKYFYGDDCILCKTPWIDIQRKNGTW